MPPQSASWLNSMVSKWETRASLFQFLAKEVWELPFVKTAVAGVIGLVTGAYTLPDETARYATAALVAMGMYALVWLRLSLRSMIDGAAARVAPAPAPASTPVPAPDMGEMKSHIERLLREEAAKMERALGKTVERLVDVANAQRQQDTLNELIVNFDDLEREIQLALSQKQSSDRCQALRSRLNSVARVIEDDCGLKNAKGKLREIEEVAQRQIRTRQITEQHQAIVFLEHEYPLVKDLIKDCQRELGIFIYDWHQSLISREKAKKELARRKQLEKEPR